MESAVEFERRFATEDACRQFLMDQRWPNGVRCPRCNSAERIYALKARPFNWVCKSGFESTDSNGQPCTCNRKNGYRFSVITHTIFQDTKIPLRLWFKIGYLMLTAKKGISSLQVRRVIFGEDSGTDWRTCWYICHRWRAAMKGDAFPLDGQIEVDETFVGGKNYNRHANKRAKGTGGFTGKVAVIGAIARKGMVVAKTIENTDTRTLDGFVRQTIGDNVSLIATDQHSGYRLLKPSGLPHEYIGHSQGEYVRGEVHTNNIESFWSLLKRGIMGQFHHVKKDYLPDLNEFSYRHNNRKNPDAFADLVTTCGK